MGKAKKDSRRNIIKTLQSHKRKRKWVNVQELPLIVMNIV
jgi:hypothetical protein